VSVKTKTRLCFEEKLS